MPFVGDNRQGGSSRKQDEPNYKMQGFSFPVFIKRRKYVVCSDMKPAFSFSNVLRYGERNVTERSVCSITSKSTRHSKRWDTLRKKMRPALPWTQNSSQNNVKEVVTDFSLVKDRAALM